MTLRTQPARRAAAPRLLAALVALAALAFLASCAGDGSTLDPLGQPLLPPRASVAAEGLNLNLVQDTDLEVVITIANEGGLPLRVLAVTADADFLEPFFPAEIEIAGDESADITVAVHAGDAAGSPYSGSVRIATDDPETPELFVPFALVVTEAPVPDLDVSTTPIDATVEVGAMTTVVLPVRNLGSGPLAISEISAADGWLTAVPTTRTLAPAATFDLSLTLDATALTLGAYSTTLTLLSDDPDESEVRIPVELWVGPFRPTLSAIQDSVFTPVCVLCHNEGSQPFGLSLQEGASYAKLVGADAGWDASLKRVEPFNPDDSFLVIKLENSDPRMQGSQMPLAAPPLDADEIAVIREWITRGAADD